MSDQQAEPPTKENKKKNFSKRRFHLLDPTQIGPSKSKKVLTH
jgi:hypothetical protein